MNKIHALTALALGILASSSGKLQVQAATYNFFVDFSTKEVSDFTAFNKTFNGDTINLNSRINFIWTGSYRFDSCPTAFIQNANWAYQLRLNGTGSVLATETFALPDLPCTTTNTSYFSNHTSVNLPSTILDALVDDDANFIAIETIIILPGQSSSQGRTLSLLGYRFDFDISYDFGTTYLFNKFLSDQQFVSRVALGGTWTFASTRSVNLKYVYTTAGNDEYYINNSNVSNIGTTRKKYAVDFNNEFFRGESIGAQLSVGYTGTDQVVLFSGTSLLAHNYNYYFLNAANLSQPIVTVPQFNFTYEVCSGGFLDINVGCFVNNALAYLTNDAPIISDATQLINAGISFVGQTFGVIGSFTTNNMFGYLVLGGFGFIVIKSLFKNDK